MTRSEDDPDRTRVNESNHPLIAAIADPSLSAPSARLRRVHALLRDDWTLAVPANEHGHLPIDVAIDASTWRVVEFRSA